MTTSTLLTSLFKYKIWANEHIFAELEKPHSAQQDLHAALRILNHIYVVDKIFAAHLSSKSHGYKETNTPDTPTLNELRKAVHDIDHWYLEYLDVLAPEHLSQKITFTFTDGSKGCMTREEILAHVATHGDYHRGAVGRIMSQLALSPPESFTGFLHKLEPQRRDGV